MQSPARIRRVVTGHDRSGKAIVVSDGIAHAVKSNPLRPGHSSVDIWKTGAMPVPLGIDAADPTGGVRTIHPAPNGTIIRIAEVPPESDAIRNMTPEQAREVFRANNNERASTWGRGGRHPLMHRTETIDYAVVLEGEITLLLDETDVNLKAGDVVIQRGTNHAWSNRSGKRCLMLYVLIDGRFDPELAAQFEGAGA
ncbi:MAG TPA: cupin domain-containing protein [Burkholderiales bacterium]|nr:cupin domain-containing protein [Burkholderiales bacterium]